MEYINPVNPSPFTIDPSDPGSTSSSLPQHSEWQQSHPPPQPQLITAGAPVTGLEEAMWRMAVRPQEGIEPAFPERPGEVDCPYYMRTGQCGFGSSCKFNHPPNRRLAATWNRGEYPERPGQPECQYYVKTGTCKFGATCKYHHPRDMAGQAGRPQLNVLNLPLRPDVDILITVYSHEQGEKDCAFYMRTGHCKYGATCRFNHPQPVLSVPSSPVFPGPTSASASAVQPYPPGLSPWATIPRSPYLPPPRLPGPSNFAPVLLPSPQGVVSVQTWNPYQPPLALQETQQQTSYVYGHTVSPQEHIAVGLYPPFMQASTSMRLPTPPSPSASGPQETLHPERPGQPECQYYMRTGDCRFGLQCRFHHPKDRNALSQASALSPMGLPIRPGAPPCNFYGRYGYCKFGPTCKFDHPFHTAYNPLLGDIPMSQYSMGISSSPRLNVLQLTETPLELQRQPSSREALEEGDSSAGTLPHGSS